MKRAIGYELTPTTAPGADADATLTAEADRRGLDLAWTYADTGIERGTAPAERPGLANAIGVIRPGDTLLVSSRRDLATDAVHVGMVERLVAKRGGTVVATDQPHVDPLVQAMSAAFAEYEAFVAMTTTPAEPQSRRRPTLPLTRTNAAPMPPVVEVERDGPDEATSGQRDVALSALAVIRGHLQAGWSAADIADELNRRGCVASGGAPWRVDQVRQIVDARQLARLQPEPGFKRASALATAPTGPRAPRVDALLSTLP